MSKYEDHFSYVSRLLGYKVQDRVTGYCGVVTHVGFDLYGCIQAIVNKAGEDKDGELHKGMWFDVHRLVLLDQTPVMEQPAFIGGPEGADNYKPTK